MISIMRRLKDFIASLPASNIIALIIAGLILGTWLTYTPPGLLGKADAVGYAVCHRIAARSFFIGDRQTPLCARCSGMYLGALLGLLYQFRSGHRGGMPVLKISILLGFFLLAFGIDGLNSYFQLFPIIKPIYVTQNWMRLLTGTGMGIGMASILLPVFNQSVWKDWESQPILNSWKQMSFLILISALIDAAILSENPLLLFPLALLSSATILVLLSMIYTIVWILLLKKENGFDNIHQLAGMLVFGFGTTMLQIGIMDLVRFILTGTWSGFFSAS
jgi:uncharacterized membrane protein